jgi:nucleoside 2-deoxyribosyltransferase
MRKSVYLAAPYSTKKEIEQYAADLRAAGITVTSSWLEEPHDPKTQMSELPPVTHRLYACRDLQDIEDAKVFVLFTDPTKQLVRQGRTFEFGFAYANGKHIVIVGSEYENIFHYLPGLRHFETWADAQRYLLR